MKRGHHKSKYHKKIFNKTSHNLHKRKKFSIRKFLGIPSWIFKGIVLVILGIILLRFSGVIFIDWFNWIEGKLWGNFIGFILILSGILCFIAWWRNNILQHRIGLKFGKW